MFDGPEDGFYELLVEFLSFLWVRHMCIFMQGRLFDVNVVSVLTATPAPGGVREEGVPGKTRDELF